MSGANYNGRQANNTSYIKNFVYATPSQLWAPYNYTNQAGGIISVITPKGTNYENLYITGDMYLDGNIITPSDITLKEDIEVINEVNTNKLMEIKASKFSFKNDTSKHIHYGFIAQEFEQLFPELVYLKPDRQNNNIKAINYMEVIPLLVSKIQIMQREIDELRSKIK